MSCFSCFSSHERRASKKYRGSKQGPVPASNSLRDPSPQSRPHNRTQPPLHRPPNEHSGKATTEATNNKAVIAAQTFTFRELATATKNFRQEYLLGEGGFGRVYKGRLENPDQMVAVKQLDRNGLQGNREFLVEVLMLSLLHHQNLVNLIGYCADGEQRLLVYEYMPLGSLEDHLLDLPPGQPPLPWFTRMKIALHAAKGLEYLHDQANPPVIYRDLKSSNILLDREYNAKLSDFGLAKLGPIGDKSHVSTRVMGTYGYCAPEYQKQAEPIFKDPTRFSELSDPLLKGDFPRKNFNQAIAVAAMCLQEDASIRPLISDVVTALSCLPVEPDTRFNSPVSTPSPQSMINAESHKSEMLAKEREKAVAEAIAWGSMSRNNSVH
ncbi:hypothetical protein DH2020_001123 [Rehmannia glutinosa]|uniref:Protein kinase domain-containing protein n=1 Tax=Rehmannia glutinosa TaxID=99300 RepID=A0ABR0XYS3_REHGL